MLQCRRRTGSRTHRGSRRAVHHRPHLSLTQRQDTSFHAAQLFLDAVKPESADAEKDHEANRAEDDGQHSVGLVGAVRVLTTQRRSVGARGESSVAFGRLQALEQASALTISSSLTVKLGVSSVPFIALDIRFCVLLYLSGAVLGGT